MWHEIHYNKLTACWALYVGNADGYYIHKLYANKLTALISARIHGYKVGA